jgi:hypothetical protein
MHNIVTFIEALVPLRVAQASLPCVEHREILLMNGSKWVLSIDPQFV